MLKKSLYLISFFIVSCSTIDLNDIEKSINSSNSTTFEEQLVCSNDTADFFYTYGKYIITLSTDTIPYIQGYRLPTKQEAKLLSNYINEDKRVLCIDNNIYYTFNYKSTIIKAGYKTEYYYIPIRTYRTNEVLTPNIDVDTEWKEKDIIDLE